MQSGELTTNAAAVLAGIRPRRVSVRVDNARSLVDSLAHANESLLPAVRDEITRRLAGSDDQEADR